ncbi:hypothetical protein ACFFIX_05675 [Metabacillus herbersteinensis]|uniref:Uncharacterized protein n=1 Tax=Metabacillus herbersteinensis TaxID=283816 RepID=A0ABV6GBZ5_9BACI
MDQNNEFFVVLDEPTSMSRETLERKQEKLSEGCCTVLDAGRVAYKGTLPGEGHRKAIE